MGFDTAYVDIQHDKRFTGESSYSLAKLITLAVNRIISQSNRPLYFFIKFGFLIAFLSIFYGIILIGKYLMYGTPVQGWTSVMVSIYFIGGLLFANLGIVGIYIGKIFDETKNRPLYIIKKTTLDDTKESILHADV
jgi:dolichol-phosphate mannosyltransferase